MQTRSKRRTSEEADCRQIRSLSQLGYVSFFAMGNAVAYPVNTPRWYFSGPSNATAIYHQGQIILDMLFSNGNLNRRLEGVGSGQTDRLEVALSIENEASFALYHFLLFHHHPLHARAPSKTPFLHEACSHVLFIEYRC